MHKSSRPLSWVAALALAATGCNLVYDIQPGELATTTGGTAGSGATAGSGGSSGSGATAGSGGAPACTPGSASCEGAVLHVCDAAGHPEPDVTCDVVAACDAAARTCIDAGSFGRLSVGVARGCVIRDDRTASCWGAAGGGAVFNDSLPMQPIAKQVPGVAKIRQISVGGGQICALDDDGRVRCWGSNSSGELGFPDNGTQTPTLVPDLTGVVEVRAAYRCTCARHADGTVDCWGDQEIGCLGTAQQAAGVQSTPTKLAGLTDIVQLLPGNYITPSCARKADGTVLCWSASLVPTPIPDVSDATDIAVAFKHVFIRSKSKGFLFSAPAQDGLSWLPAAPYDVPGNPAAMRAGNSFCTLGGDGVVACTALDDPPQAPPSPVPVPGPPPGDVAEIAVGSGFLYGRELQCLRLAATPLADAVYCWGDDLGGALGAGAPDLFPSPVQLEGVTGLTSITAAQTSTTAVLADGSVSTWGESFSLVGDQMASPQTVPFLADDNAAVHPHDFSRRAYVRKTSGATVLVEQGVVKPGERLLSSGFDDFIDARTYDHWDIGLRQGGTIVVHAADAMGNERGIFGNGTVTATPGENQTVPNITTAQAIAAFGDDYNPGPAHVCALLGPAGTVSCWGENYYGQVGNGQPSGDPVTTPTAVSIPGGEAAVSIAVGRAFTCAATASGKVYCWGANYTGQLGVPGVQEFSAPTTAVTGITNAKYVTAREAHVCALLADETVKCWGANDVGQLGNGTFVTPATPVVVTGLAAVERVTAGSEHTCARHIDGTVHCWGSSYWGQIGNGVTGQFAEPLPVLGL